MTRRGRRLRVIDNLSTGKRENLGERESESWELIEHDIREPAGLARALGGVDRVFHLAAMTSVEESVQKPEKAHAINVGGTLNVLSAARQAGANKLIFASSTAVYGNSEKCPTEETDPFAPCSPYAASKAAGELYCRVYSELYGLPTVCLRYFNVFGPRQDPASPYAAVIPRFVDRILAGKRPIIYGDGEQTRDFVFVGDVVAANLKAAESEARSVSLNVATGRRISLNELAVMINELAGAQLKPVYEPAREGEIRHSEALVERARETIGFEAQVPIREGLKRTIEWFARRGRSGKSHAVGD